MRMLLIHAWNDKAAYFDTRADIQPFPLSSLTDTLLLADARKVLAD
ncbi:MAG: hypothetical protein R6W92_12105 [Desulfocurvibacter africanus]